MQTALEVRRTRLKNPEAAKLDHMRLPFKIVHKKRKTNEEVEAEINQKNKLKIEADIAGMIDKLGGEKMVTRVVISRKEHERRQQEAQKAYEERQRKKREQQGK